MKFCLVCRHPMFGRLMTLLALKKPGPQNYYSLIRPNTGESYFDMEVCPCPSSMTAKFPGQS